MLTSRKSRPIARSESVLRDTRLVVVATEGEATEPLYFSAFGDTRVQVRILPCVDGESSPRHVLKNVLGYKEQYDIGGGDELWIVIDRDRWKDEMLSEVAQEAATRGIGLAVSNPCFELWLALHLEADLPDPVDSGSLEAHLRQELGIFNKSNFDVARLLAGLEPACQKADALDVEKDHRWPNNMGTRVYRVIRSIQRLGSGVTDG